MKKTAATQSQALFGQSGVLPHPHASHLILLAEDEALLLHLVQDSLSKAGYEVLTASSLAGARQHWTQRSKDIHLIVTDWSLGDGSGLELAKAALEQEPNVHAIIMTGYNEKTLDLGGDLNQRAYLIEKPFLMNDLLNIISALFT